MVAKSQFQRIDSLEPAMSSHWRKAKPDGMTRLQNPCKHLYW